MTGRQDTIAAVATPQGTGGIGIVRLSGPASLAIAREITGLAQVRPRYACYTAFRDRDGGLIDRGILLYYRAPSSYTGEDVIELQGHGGRVVMGLLLKAVLAAGARPARPGEFTERAYLNGKLDLIQAEAVADLIESRSVQAARSAARSLEGEFSSRVHALRDALVSLRVLVEGALDFPEEEIDFLKDESLGVKLSDIESGLEHILEGARRGRRLREGLRVAIIGRPNVGKSSLLNALTRTDRAIVTEIAGTTRDVIEEELQLDGLAINIVDTAGIREPGDAVEREGVRRTMAELERADLLLLVTDRDETTLDEAPWQEMPAGSRSTILVHNKIDLRGVPPGIRESPEGAHVSLSARTGEGLPLLIDALQSRAGETSGEDVVLARARHVRALEEAKRHVDDASRLHADRCGPELIAEELGNAQKSLGEITGEFHAEDLLGEIFSRFCIGK